MTIGSRDFLDSVKFLKLYSIRKYYTHLDDYGKHGDYDNIRCYKREGYRAILRFSGSRQGYIQGWIVIKTKVSIRLIMRISILSHRWLYVSEYCDILRMTTRVTPSVIYNWNVENILIRLTRLKIYSLARVLLMRWHHMQKRLLKTVFSLYKIVQNFLECRGETWKPYTPSQSWKSLKPCKSKNKDPP